MNRVSKHNLLGFTLIELMVALSLGLIIMLAATQLFITNQIGFNLQRGMGDVQENGRFALDYMSLSVRSAGYNNVASNGLTVPALITETADLPSATSNPASKISCNDCFDLTISSTVLKSDRMVIRQALNPTAGDYRDCEGNVVAVPASNITRFIVTRYFVRSDSTSNSNAALACDAGYYDEGDTTVTNFGDDGVVLLSNIDNFQVQYGIAANGAAAGARFPIRYVNLTSYVGLTAPRPAISSVRLAVYVRSADKVTSLLPISNDIKVLDYTVNKNALADKYVRSLFSTTLALRNSM